MTRARPPVVAAVAVLLLTGCTSFTATAGAGARRAAPPPPRRAARAAARRAAGPIRTAPPSTSTSASPTTCSPSPAPRPSASPPTCPSGELVFRLVPNGPARAAAGNRLDVDAVRGTDVTGGGYDAAGAAAPGGLYRVRLARACAPGQTTRSRSPSP